MASVTGTMRSTVVTLSRKAESTAVVICSMKSMPAGRARAACADQIAKNWKTPERREIETRIIMPVRRPMVFQSMPASASFWSRTPTTIMTPAPTSATIERFTCSEITMA